MGIDGAPDQLRDAGRRQVGHFLAADHQHRPGEACGDGRKPRVDGGRSRGRGRLDPKRRHVGEPQVRRDLRGEVALADELLGVHGGDDNRVRRLEPSGAQRGAGGLGHEIRQTFLTLAEAGHPRPGDPDTRQRLTPGRIGIRYYFTPGVWGVSTLFAGAGGHEPFRGAPSGDGAAGTTGRRGTPAKEAGGGADTPRSRISRRRYVRWRPRHRAAWVRFPPDCRSAVSIRRRLNSSTAPRNPRGAHCSMPKRRGKRDASRREAQIQALGSGGEPHLHEGVCRSRPHCTEACAVTFWSRA